MTSPSKDMIKYEIRRQQLKRRRRLVGTFAGAVVLIAALALMVPALSMTRQSAVEEAGVVPTASTFQAAQIEGADASGSAGAPGMPAQLFEGTLQDSRTGDTVLVKVEAPEGAFPAGTTMTLAEVADEGVVELAKQKAAADANMPETARTAAVDITFNDTQGNEVEPATEVRVNMSVQDAAPKSGVAVVHVGDDHSAELVKTVDAPAAASAVGVHARATAAAPDATGDIASISSVAAATRIPDVTFDASSFSVYAVVYTVDFAYEAAIEGEQVIGRFSIEGGTSIALSQLVEVVGVLDDTDYEDARAFMGDVSEVSFSDESLVEASKRLFVNDWDLKSKKAFATEEELSITMKDGRVFTMKVTDDSATFYNLKDSATSMTADLKANTSVDYDTNTQMYSANVTTTFNIPTDKAKQEKNYVVELADDIVIPDSALNIKRKSLDQNLRMESFEYWLEKQPDGKYVLKISFLDDYLNEVDVIGKNTINLALLVKDLDEVSEEQSKFDFTNELPVSVDNNIIHYPENDNGSSDISVDKSYSSMGTAQIGGNTVSYVDYTVTVSTTKGTGEAITLTDTLSGLTAKYNYWQNRELSATDVEIRGVTASGQGASQDYTFTKGANNDSFSLQLAQITGPGSYTVTYRYYLDKDLTADLQDGDTRLEASGSNTAIAETSKIHDSDNDGFSYVKSDQPVEVAKTGSYDASTHKITWTITLKITKDQHDLYDEAFSAAQNLTITREEGNGFTTTQNGNTIHFNDPGTYTITYTTDVANQYMYDAYKVTNKATVDEDKYDTGNVDVDVPTVGTGSIDKQLVSSELASSDPSAHTETYNTTWHVNFTLPSTLPAGTVLRDTLTYSNKGNIDHKFTEEQKSAFIAALEEIFGRGAFDVQVNDVNSGHELVLTLKNKWTNNTGNQEASLTYTTTSVVDLDVVNRGLSTQTSPDKFTNRFSIDDVSASADFAYRKEVNKIDPDYKDGTKVTSHTITRENNLLKWEIVLNLSADYNDMTIADTLPAGLTVEKVEIGGEYNLDSYSQYADAGNTRTFSYDGGNRYIANNVDSITAQKTDEGTSLNVRLVVDDNHPRSGFFKEGDQLHMIVYAEVDDSEFGAISDLTKSYTNTVSVTADGKPLGDDEQTQKTTLESSALSKSEIELAADEWKNFHYLSYQVPINLDGHAMLPADAEDKTYSLDDVVSFNKKSPDGKDVNFMLVPGSVKLQTKNSNDEWEDVDSGVKWTYQYIESKDGDLRYKTILVSGLPDNTVLRLIYTYEVDLSDTEAGQGYSIGDVTNSATVHGETDRTITIHTHKTWQEFSSDASTESSYTLTLSKVDLSDYNKLLPGTKFVLEKYVNGTWVVIDAISQESQYLSAERDLSKFGSGITLSDPTKTSYQIFVTANSEGSRYGTLKMYMPTNDQAYQGSYYEPGVCYRVREYEAPEGGYTVSDDPDKQPAGYFWFSKYHDGQEYTGQVVWPDERIRTLADDLSTESDTFYITNAKEASLKITKKIIGDAELPKDTLKDITFTVYNSANEEVGRLTYDDILKNQNVITGDKIIDGQTYTVKETGIDAKGVTWTATYAVNGSEDETTASGTGVVSSQTEIEVGEVPIVNNIGTVTVTNKYDSKKTSIEVTKEWVDYEGKAIAAPASKTVKFQVYQQKQGESEGSPYIASGAEEAETYEIAFNEATKTWGTTTVNGLPQSYYDEDGNLQSYSYYVVETEPTAHLTTTYRLGERGEESTSASDVATASPEQPIVIKNTEDEPPHVSVTKNWFDADGQTDYTSKTTKDKVYFKVFVNWDWNVYDPVAAGVIANDPSAYNAEKKYFIVDKVDNGDGSYSWETVDVRFPQDYKPNSSSFTNFWIQEVDENGNAVNDAVVTYMVGDDTEPHPIVMNGGEGDLGSVTITNTQKRGLTVKKAWVDGESHESSPNDISYHLYRKPVDGGDWESYRQWEKLTPSSGWSKTYSDLEEGYVYKVEEQNPPQGYTVSYSTDDEGANLGESITITNTKNPTGIAVKKLWDVPDGTAAPDSVTVQLMKAAEIDDPDAITLHIHYVDQWNNTVIYDGDLKVKPGTDVWIKDDNWNRAEGYTLVQKNKDYANWHVIENIQASGTLGIVAGNASPVIEYEKAVTPDVSNGTPVQSGEVVLNASNNWYKEWTNLDDGYYYVVETKVGDAELASAGYEVTYSDNNSGIKTGTITVTNRKIDTPPSQIDLKIIKIDEDTRSDDSQTLLPGAKFKLFKYVAPNGAGSGNYVVFPDETSCEKTTSDVEGEDFGTLVFEGLPDGQYMISETESPAGYVKIADDDIYFDIANGVITRYRNAYNGTARDFADAIAEDTDTSSVTYSNADKSITVGNTSGSALPNTGGIGTTIFTIVGLVLIVGGIVLFVRRKR